MQQIVNEIQTCFYCSTKLENNLRYNILKHSLKQQNFKRDKRFKTSMMTPQIKKH